MGEQVRVVSDESEVFRLQEERGGWNDKMRKVADRVLHIYILYEWYTKKQRVSILNVIRTRSNWNHAINISASEKNRSF